MRSEKLKKDWRHSFDIVELNALRNSFEIKFPLRFIYGKIFEATFGRLSSKIFFHKLHFSLDKVRKKIIFTHKFTV